MHEPMGEQTVPSAWKGKQWGPFANTRIKSASIGFLAITSYFLMEINKSAQIPISDYVPVSKFEQILYPTFQYDRVLNQIARVSLYQCLMELVVDGQWCFERDRTHPPILP